jgi:hypothetical protein
MTLPSLNLAYVEEGLARLTDKFQKPVIQALTKIYLEAVQDVEEAAFDVLASRILANNPEGHQLDLLGKIVNEPRAGRTDEEYLVAVKVRIRTNRSQGRTLDIIEVSNLASDNAAFQYREDRPHYFSVVIEETSTAIAKTLIRALGRAKAASYGGVLYFNHWPESEALTFDSTAGGTSATGGGLGSRHGATSGYAKLSSSQKVFR